MPVIDAMRRDNKEQDLHALVKQARWMPATYEAFKQYNGDPYSPDDLLHMQKARLADILAYAVSTVPAMRKLGIHVSRDADPLDLLRLFPITTKDGVRQGFLDHCSDELRPEECVYTFSSGSSGIPLRVIRDGLHLAHVNAKVLSALASFGISFDRKVLKPFTHKAPRWQEYSQLGSGVAHVGEFGYLEKGNVDAGREAVRRSLEFHPHVIYNYPSRIDQFRELLERHDKAIDVQLLMSTGEPLDPSLRNRLQQHFGVPMFDQYGLTEVAAVATQCRLGTYHIECERLWVEILDADGNSLPDGTEGEIVVTGFFNKAMPFIRYQTGDRGSLSAIRCNCGKPQKALLVPAERSPKRLILPDGTRKDIFGLLRLLEEYPVRRLQIVQEAINDLRILLAPDETFCADDCAEIAGRIKDLLQPAPSVKVELSEVADFYPGPGGKISNFISTML
ncbi:phenylacetate--CoA ligase family protein [Salinispora arenicola]|uniref:Capsular polysaccharide biosynthesis protein n=1 Tax=Salinispora arenicola TaxID=168697 RepID=A0A542XM52_SALAC|nr:AMP-binding protein [Salinispora arenicola]TQL36924.1 phenylacetate-coenzyme A ligase PaaK-like adenylate-forming protein [Salinispora arenicola]GIM87117.1 capsular polysaccharide biosynthesis protein [Salinispora arenicola]